MTSRIAMKTILTFCALLFAPAIFAVDSVVFNARTAQSGKWSDAQTWEGRHQPQAGDFVQVRSGHLVTYDVNSDAALRMLHVAGTLAFSREVSTLLDVGLIKVEPGETTTEDGSNCDDEAPPPPAGAYMPVLEIGTLASPIPAGVKATIRLRHFKGTNPETLPAIIACGGRWEVHGAPMNRTWLKLTAPARAGDMNVTVEQPATDWHAGDHIIITTGETPAIESGATFEKRQFGKRKPVGTFDPNDGAGFWWANGRNTFTRNVACENDRYGFHFQIAKTLDFNPVRRVRSPDGKFTDRDVRTLPFLRFEDNESHSEGLFDFRFGDEEHGSVHGDREHPFIVRNLRAWAAHYVIRPNVQFFLLDGLRVQDAAFGIYHPDYDAHVYRDITFHNVTAEPINGGHDEESHRLTFADCNSQRDPLVQLTGIAPQPGLAGHFRGLTLTNSNSRESSIVDFGGGPRTKKTEHPVS